MLDRHLAANLTARLTEALGESIVLSRVTPVTGGDINTCFLLESNRGSYFVKTSRHLSADAMFQAENHALQVLARAAHDLKIPAPITQGRSDDQCFLALEALDFTTQQNWPLLGQELVRLHRVTSVGYGWPDNNYIGSTVQLNRTFDNWSDFWWQCRMLPQLELAFQNGYGQALQGYLRDLQSVSEGLLAGHQPLPSLLHGDLWRGNIGFCQGLQPALFDPACYYGDRETDIAMTELFGSLPTPFYSAYLQAWPINGGYSQRKPLYNLYHLLNHLNLFGGGYLNQCLATIHKLRDIRL